MPSLQALVSFLSGLDSSRSLAALFERLLRATGFPGIEDMAHSEACGRTAGLEERVEKIESKDIERTHGNQEYYPRAEQRKIIRKIDFRLIFPLGLMLGASFLDRANIGNAAIAG